MGYFPILLKNVPASGTKYFMEVFSMTKITKRVISAALVVMMLASVCFAAVGCNKSQGTEYTYKAYSTALGTNWNPHTWETNADDTILSYLSSPFVDLSIKNSTTGEYQWVYEMATSITDVTEANQGDLTKYAVSLPEGQTADQTKAGYVFEIKLNEKAAWENGQKITADDYIYSMEQLLNPKMRNYRANLYYNGESAVAGGLAYYNSEAPIYANDWLTYNETEEMYEGHVAEGTTNGDGNVTANINGKDEVIYFSFSQEVPFFGATAEFIYDDYGYGPAGYFNIPYTGDTSDPTKLPAYVSNVAEEGEEAVWVQDVLVKWSGEENAYGVIAATPELLSDMKALATNFGDDNELAWNEFAIRLTGYGDKVEYDKVGCYKVDDYTIRYVTQSYIDLNYFLTSCTSTWLVYKDLYEAGKTTTGDLVTTNYGTSKETSMSYGTYKMQSLQDAKQVVFVQNEKWYGFEEAEDGSLISYTNFEVDGEKRQQYQTTKVVIDVMDDNAAKNAFLKGEITEWSPAADELSTYSYSDQLYRVDETYTMSFFFNTNETALKNMDTTKGNANSVVLTNENFRKAFSLAVDRAEFVTATQGYKPAYSLMNELYFYDVYNDPTSMYRSTDEAMQAICNLYGVEYGEGKAYATLEDAYKSITGYNLTEAKALMKTACDELVAAGLYTAGADIKIKIGWAKGALTSDDQKQASLMNKYINAAIEGSGFGTITLEPIGNIEDRYSAVPEGEYAIGYGAWGGAAFYPFRNFQVYMDPAEYDINEAANYDPTVDTLTLKVNGEDVTMTWQAWSRSMVGTGVYAAADFATKLAITAQLEEAFLKTYYRIPLCATTICSMLSYQCSYYTETYNIMYGFGGLRLMKYEYNDADWAKYVADQGGTLNYE